MAQLVKNPPAMHETWVRFLGWEDSPRGGHVNPLQYSCLENPIDRGAWWVTIHEGRKELDMTEVTKHAQGLTNVILLIIFCCFVVALLVSLFLVFFFSGTTDVSGSLMKLMDSLKNPIECVGLQNLETFTLKYSH